MGQAKRRKLLDPYYGEKKTMLHTLIDDALFNQDCYLAAFSLFLIKPVVIIDAFNFEGVVVRGIDESSDLPQRIESQREAIFNTDFSNHGVLISMVEDVSMIATIPRDEINRSLVWAQYKGLTFKTSEKFPQRITYND